MQMSALPTTTHHTTLAFASIPVVSKGTIAGINRRTVSPIRSGARSPELQAVSEAGTETVKRNPSPAISLRTLSPTRAAVKPIPTEPPLDETLVPAIICAKNARLSAVKSASTLATHDKPELGEQYAHNQQQQLRQQAQQQIQQQQHHAPFQRQQHPSRQQQQAEPIQARRNDPATTQNSITDDPPASKSTRVAVFADADRSSDGATGSGGGSGDKDDDSNKLSANRGVHDNDDAIGIHHAARKFRETHATTLEAGIAQALAELRTQYEAKLAAKELECVQALEKQKVAIETALRAERDRALIDQHVSFEKRFACDSAARHQSEESRVAKLIVDHATVLSEERKHFETAMANSVSEHEKKRHEAESSASLAMASMKAELEASHRSAIETQRLALESDGRTREDAVRKEFARILESATIERVALQSAIAASREALSDHEESALSHRIGAEREIARLTKALRSEKEARQRDVKALEEAKDAHQAEIRARETSDESLKIERAAWLSVDEELQKEKIAHQSTKEALRVEREALHAEKAARFVNEETLRVERQWLIAEKKARQESEEALQKEKDARLAAEAREKQTATAAEEDERHRDSTVRLLREELDALAATHRSNTTALEDRIKQLDAARSDALVLAESTRQKLEAYDSVISRMIDAVTLFLRSHSVSENPPLAERALARNSSSGPDRVAELGPTKLTTNHPTYLHAETVDNERNDSQVGGATAVTTAVTTARASNAGDKNGSNGDDRHEVIALIEALSPLLRQTTSHASIELVSAIVRALGPESVRLRHPIELVFREIGCSEGCPEKSSHPPCSKNAASQVIDGSDSRNQRSPIHFSSATFPGATAIHDEASEESSVEAPHDKRVVMTIVDEGSTKTKAKANDADANAGTGADVGANVGCFADNKGDVANNEFTGSHCDNYASSSSSSSPSPWALLLQPSPSSSCESNRNYDERNHNGDESRSHTFDYSRPLYLRGYRRDSGNADSIARATAFSSRARQAPTEPTFEEPIRQRIDRNPISRSGYKYSQQRMDRRFHLLPEGAATTISLSNAASVTDAITADLASGVHVGTAANVTNAAFVTTTATSTATTTNTHSNINTSVNVNSNTNASANTTAFNASAENGVVPPLASSLGNTFTAPPQFSQPSTARSSSPLKDRPAQPSSVFLAFGDEYMVKGSNAGGSSSNKYTQP